MKNNTIEEPTVSVIVAVFNQEKFVGRCLRSLISQTLASCDYEVIVVDDGSTDQTPYALSLFEGGFGVNIRILVNEKNLGLPAAVNRGIAEAAGKYVVRVDSDDFVNTDFLNFLKCFLDTNVQADAVACDYFLVDDSEEIIERCDCEKDPIACGIMFQKKQLIEIGLYDENFLRYEDIDLRIRFEKNYSIERLAIPLYRYRRHSNNITNDVEQMVRHRKRLMLKHGDFDG